MEKTSKKFWLGLIIIALTLAIFYNFFFKNLFPYPGNFMLAWYEPWKSDHLINQTITIVHKAVADDTFRQYLPFRLLSADLFKQYALPLWNPYNGNGMPLFATMHYGFLNPFMLYFIFLNTPYAWSLHIITQFVLLCIFTYLYCRSIKIGFMGSLLAFISLALSGFVITKLIYGDFIYTLSLLPFILYLIEEFKQNPKTKKIFLVAPGITFIFFSGAPQIIFYILTTIFCYTLYRINSIKNILIFFAHCILGVGLAGIQLIPTFELYQNSAITTEASKFIFDRFLVPLQHLITIIIPNYYGNQATYNYWGAADYAETIAAIGSIPCFFVFLSIWSKNKNHKSLSKFYLIALLLTIIFTLDFFVTRFFFKLPIPILSTGIPTRIFMLTSFFIAILASIGFEKLVADKMSLKMLIYKTFPFLIILASISIVTAVLFLSHTLCPGNTSNIPCRTVALRNTTIELIIFVIFFLLLIISWFKNKNFSFIFQFFTILLVIGIGVYNANKFLPFSDEESFNPKNDLIKILQTKTLDGRVFGFDDANIKTDFATQFKFYDPNYYDPLYNKRYGELVAYANDKGLLRSDVEINSVATLSGDLKFRRDRLLNLLAVKYFIFKKTQLPLTAKDNLFWENNTWYIKKNPDALPQVFLVDNYEVISSQQQILKTLFSTSFKPRSTVILEKEIKYKPDKDIKDINEENKVKIVNYQENKLTINSSTSNDKILVLLDNYYPGWKATIDEKPTNIFRVDYTFRAVLLPRGTHTLKFIYQPDSLRFGIYLSLFTLIVYLSVFLSLTKIKFFQSN